MAENLTVVAPDIRHSYEIQGAGKFSGLKQTGYRVSTPDKQDGPTSGPGDVSGKVGKHFGVVMRRS